MVSVVFGCDRFVYLDLRLLGAWKKFHTYSPKLWFNGDLPSYKVKKYQHNKYKYPLKKNSHFSAGNFSTTMRL